MIVLSGADLVLPDRILAPGTLVVDNGRIAEIRPGAAAAGFGFEHHYIVPGFVDVHVHGVEGIDTLDPEESVGGLEAVRAIAARLPRYGVVAFCPTTVACAPAALRSVLGQVRRAREAPGVRSARVLPAHLESNFINPEYRGAQPLSCLRVPAGGSGRSGVSGRSGGSGGSSGSKEDDAGFSAEDILQVIEDATPDVGIVTLAPEIQGGVELVRRLAGRGHRVSLGHSGATFEEALAAIDAGARQATHLFNRMPPLDRRRPGLAGAVLQADEIAAEIICDGMHVHPAMVRVAAAAKRPARLMAITDGTAVAGLPPGARARLGGQPIVAGHGTAVLADGTRAGSLLTMDGAFRMLIGEAGLSMIDAAAMCATTAARELGLVGHGLLAVDAVADFVVLDRALEVVQTYVAGTLAYSRDSSNPLRPPLV